MQRKDLERVFKMHGEKAQENLFQKNIKKEQFYKLCREIALDDHCQVSIRRFAFEYCAIKKGALHTRICKVGLKDPNMTIRLHTMHGIHRSQVPSRMNLLFDLLDDESGGIRINALTILHVDKPKKLKRVIKKYKSDPKPYIRAFLQKVLATK